MSSDVADTRRHKRRWRGGNFPPSHHAQLVLPHSSTHISTASQRRAPGHVWRCCCCIRAAILHLTGHALVMHWSDTRQTLVTHSSHTRHALVMIKKNLLFRCHCRVMGEDLRGNNKIIKPPSRCAFIIIFARAHTHKGIMVSPRLLHSGCSTHIPPADGDHCSFTGIPDPSRAWRTDLFVHFKSTCRD